VLLLAVGPSARPAVGQGIADNSFLIEEAYNQERGVVQHISAWQRALRSTAWAFTFTQEWPLVTQTHQLSYTIPLQRTARPSTTGLGDAALNYRYQLRAGARVAINVYGVWKYLVYDAFGKLVAECGLPTDGEGGVKFVQQDWQGSVRAVSNSNGFVVARTDHQAFGEEVGLAVGTRSVDQGYSASRNGCARPAPGCAASGSSSTQATAARTAASWWPTWPRPT